MSEIVNEKGGKGPGGWPSKQPEQKSGGGRDNNPPKK